MKIKLFFVILFISLSFVVKAQSEFECKVLGIKWDTIECSNDMIISEITYCESSKQQKEGISYFTNGKEYLWFKYNYDKSSKKIKNITFRTFRFSNSGYVTNQKYAVVSFINGENPKLKLKFKKDNFTLDFAKVLTQINSK